ncbi:hypothetical protein B0T25DRAFT_581993 [Lasiosphaeria hispida]|uniref:Uncharacterized protein n=1 Tax=Lasiosphaeria hispida TaxID=260671 RepID=A0AAJ0HDS2_9PEZI|nr:hypothetical protein B0T25DRAFT_581993 [Lasiosphaeria hispida]
MLFSVFHGFLYRSLMKTRLLQPTWRPQKHMILKDHSLECLLISGTDHPTGTKPTELTLPSWVPNFYAFTHNQSAMRFAEKATPLPKSMLFRPCISDDGTTLICDVILLQTGKEVFSITGAELTSPSPARLRNYIQQMEACSPSHPSGIPHLQALFWLLFNLNARFGTDVQAAFNTSNPDNPFIFDAGIRFYSCFADKWPPHQALLSETNPAGPDDVVSKFMEDFEANFLGSGDHDPIRWPPLPELREMLHLNSDNSTTALLSRSLEMLRLQTIFGTENGDDTTRRAEQNAVPTHYHYRF